MTTRYGPVSARKREPCQGVAPAAGWEDVAAVDAPACPVDILARVESLGPEG
jgi:hypothetical protein